MKRILVANRSSRFGYWLIITGTILAACGSPDDKGLSPKPTPATVAAASPTSQSSVVKTAVAVPPAIMVRDQKNDPVPGIEVTFAVTQGSGTITGANQTTDANGEASATSWTPGSRRGPQRGDGFHRGQRDQWQPGDLHCDRHFADSLYH